MGDIKSSQTNEKQLSYISDLLQAFPEIENGESNLVLQLACMAVALNVFTNSITFSLVDLIVEIVFDFYKSKIYFYIQYYSIQVLFNVCNVV